jgi:hypothetical protein
MEKEIRLSSLEGIVGNRALVQARLGRADSRSALAKVSCFLGKRRLSGMRLSFCFPHRSFSSGSAAGQKRESFPRRVCPCYGEGKGGKVKSQVAYDTVLEIGGRLDDGLL